MADELVSGVLREPGLRVLVATTAGLSQHARALHQTRVTAAELLAEAMTASALLAGLQLQKGSSRVNVQLECDGPLRGLFADAGTDGTVRGYVKNPLVDIQGNLNAFRYRPALGNSGFLSVLRDLGGGEFYRSSIELSAMDLSLDLERFFESSEQLPGALFLDVAGDGEEPLRTVAGVLLQPLPDGDRAELARLRERLRADGTFRAALTGTEAITAAQLAKALFPRPDLELTSRYPLSFSCTCSEQRVHDALLSTGAKELQSMLEEDGKAEVTCAFCSRVYQVDADGLGKLLAQAKGNG